MLNVVKVPDDASGGGGFFSRLVAALKAALGLGDGAPSSLRARMSGHANRGIGGWWTKDRMGHAVDRLMKEAGLSREGAAGLVARWSAIEASGGPTSENANGPFGIGQWLDRGPQ